MVFIPVPSCYQTTLFYNISGQVCMNTITLFNPVADEASVCEAANNIMYDFWTDTYDDQIGTGCSLYQIKTVSLESESASFALLVIDPAVTGQRTSPVLPTNVSATCTFLTGNRGRSYRGRWFVAGMTEDMVTGNLLNTAHHDALQASFAAMPSLLTGTDFAHVIASRFHNGVARAIGVYTYVLTYRMNFPVYTQRRRLRQGSI